MVKNAFVRFLPSDGSGIGAIAAAAYACRSIVRVLQDTHEFMHFIFEIGINVCLVFAAPPLKMPHRMRATLVSNPIRCFFFFFKLSKHGMAFACADK